MEKTYRCILSHQTPLDGGFRNFEAGKEYPDSVIPAVSREWNEQGPGDPSPALFEPVKMSKAAARGQEVKVDDN